MVHAGKAVKMNDRIRIWVKDLDTGKCLEEVGYCLTSSPQRAIEMYDEEQAWIAQGYNADLAWEWADPVKNAASVLGRRTSPRKAASSAANGRTSKTGGRPRKVQPTE